MNTKISFMNSCMNHKDFKPITLESALSDIRTEKYKHLIDALPPYPTPEYKKAKERLPAFVFGGLFKNEVRASNFVQSSGVITIDIDNLDSPDHAKEVKRRLFEVPEMYAAWISPSGHGVKGLVKVNPQTIQTAQDCKNLFNALQNYLSLYDVTIDKSGKDISRLCYVSSDKDVLINPFAVDFEFVNVEEAKPQTDKEGTIVIHDGEALSRCLNILNKATLGSYHNARLRAGHLAGGFIHAGQLEEDTAIKALEELSRKISAENQDSPEVIAKELKAIHDGIATGKNNPLPEKPPSRDDIDYSTMPEFPPFEDTTTTPPSNDEQHESKKCKKSNTDVKQPRFTVSYGDDLADNATAPNYIINNILETDSHGVLYGASQSFKSFLALLMAWCICTGKSFAGNQVFNAGKVLVICGEGKGGIQRRIKALKIALGSFNDNLIVLNENISIDKKEDLDGIRELIEFHKPVLVIFDTFSSLNGGINENDNSETGAALKAIKEACSNGITSSLIIHHSGKDETKGARGAGVFKNNTDFQFEMKRSSDDMKTSLICHKMKDGEKFHDLYFDAHIVELGLTRQDGSNATSLILNHTDHAPQKAKPKLSDRDMDVLNELRKALDQHGIPTPPDIIKSRFEHEPEKAPTHVVHVSKWKEFSYRVIHLEKESQRVTFANTKKHLENLKKIGMYDGLVWIAYT